MSTMKIEIISGIIGSVLITVFVLGLAESISSGAAGFWGGLPFWSICILVLPLVFYDLWSTCFRKR